MSPFDKSYTSVVDWKPVQRHAAQSRARTQQREERLQSPDPLVRLAAQGNLGPMSAPTGNPKLLKNSKLG